MIVVIIILLIIVVITVVIYRQTSWTISDRDIYYQSLEEKKHKDLGHKRVRSVIDFKMGRFQGHWEDKNGNRV